MQLLRGVPSDVPHGVAVEGVRRSGGSLPELSNRRLPVMPNGSLAQGIPRPRFSQKTEYIFENTASSFIS